MHHFFWDTLYQNYFSYSFYVCCVKVIMKVKCHKKRCLSNRKICSGVPFHLFVCCQSFEVTFHCFNNTLHLLRLPYIFHRKTPHCPQKVSGSRRNPSGRMFRSVLLLLPLLVAVAAVPAERTQVYLVSPPCLSLRLSIR